MKHLCILLILLFSSIACSQELDNKKNFHTSNLENQRNKILEPSGKTIKTRFLPPKGFKRYESAKDSFATYLRNLPLKKNKAEVLYYNGKIKRNHNIYGAVVDLEIGKRNLHQCADAIMRLRAEYLWKNKNYDKIHFNFTNGFRVDYSKWMKGNRVIVKGNKCYWKKITTPSNTYNTFWKYMEIIFSYAGTLSLSQELNPVNINNIQIGDIFIQGGSPGHAVIVVDMVINKETGRKVFMLAQSYMPAQEIQILLNPTNKKISPWYSHNFGDVLITPEWEFKKTDLKRFPK